METDGVFFITTGFPKSGNTWIETMLSEVPGVGGYSPSPGRGTPLVLARLWGTDGFREMLDRRGVAFQDAVRNMLRPQRGSPLLPDSDRAEAERILEPLATWLGVIRNNYTQEGWAGRVDAARLAAPLFGRPAWAGGGVEAAWGCPSKHQPPGQVRAIVPGFRIVNIVRDPRDVIVSYFYHDMGSLDRARMDLIAEIAGGRGRTRHDWLDRYLSFVGGRLVEYHADWPEGRPGVLVVRYEHVLMGAPRELARIAEFLGLRPGRSDLEAIARRYDFEAVAGSGDERLNSFIRKGRSGDWRNYFDRRFLRALGPAFVEAVRRLGYEPDDAWTASLPERAPRELDLSRFRPRRSSAQAFIELWKESPDLRARYANPFDVCEPGCFVDHLRTLDEPRVREWFRTVDHLVKEWGVSIEETQHH